MHVPVLPDETVDLLDIDGADVVLDATAGGGGHASLIAKRLSAHGRLIAMDRDREALERVRERLRVVACETSYIQGNFRDLHSLLATEGIDKITKAIFDLGISSDQLDLSGRGFSFQKDEPLLMTMEVTPKEDALTAREIVNSWEEEHIADIIWGYGGERFAKRIARGIVTSRAEKEIKTTAELVSVIMDSVPAWYRHRKLHPATKTFQALRITVNDELEAISEGLRSAFELLESGGRIAVIAFHEHEDRFVKRYFKSLRDEKRGTLLTKKPISPTESEVSANPRARSAHLRGIEKV